MLDRETREAVRLLVSRAQKARLQRDVHRKRRCKGCYGPMPELVMRTQVYCSRACAKRYSGRPVRERKELTR